MSPLVTSLIATLDAATDGTVLDDAIVTIALLFEKARGLTSHLDPDVASTIPNTQDVLRLRQALVACAERTGHGAFALGKCFDPSLKPLLVSLLRRHLDGDPWELYQTLIALDNLGESVFAGTGGSLLDVERNRSLAHHYLQIVS